MRNGYRVIDSDLHVVEPLDLFDRYLDDQWKPRAPRPISNPWYPNQGSKRKVLWDNCARLYDL